MPKVKRNGGELPQDGKKPRLDLDITTDVNKTLCENVENRFQHWEKVDQEIVKKQDRIYQLKTCLQSTLDSPENRPLISAWRAEINKLESEIRRARRSNDQIEYLYCVAKVLRSSEREVGRESFTAVSAPIKVSASGPLRPRKKKKKLPHNASADTHTVMVKPVSGYFMSSCGDKPKSAKKLAESLHEIPVDSAEIEYCPTCVNVVMEYNDKCPSIYCSKCGLTIEVLDNTSASVHDKETMTHLPFTYRPKLHFISWIKRITGKLRFSIPQDVIDEITYCLYKRQIKDLNSVTWACIDDIVRTLAHSDKKFADYYPHVYQITNIIRGKPILSFTEEEEQEIFEYFDPIFLLWEANKDKFCVERSNFMYNALVLQIIFMILKYPPSVIKIFNMIKGDSNLKFYDNVIKMICTALGETPFTTSELELMKHGKVRDMTEWCKKEEDSSSSCSVLLD